MDIESGPDHTNDTVHGSPLIVGRHDNTSSNSKSLRSSRRRHKHISKRDKTRLNYLDSRSRSGSHSFSHSPPDYSRSYSHSPFERTPPSQRHHYRRKHVHSRSGGYRSRSTSYSPPHYRPTFYRGGASGPGSPHMKRRVFEERDMPEASRVLGVFGLNLDTKEKDVKDEFRRFGPIEKVVIVYDHQTGRSRGFGFVYFEDIADAEDAKDTMNGYEMLGRKIRVDFSITKRPHTPTPGIYMGKPSSSTKRRNERERERYGNSYELYEREPRYQPKVGRSGYYRSRSRSYSPRYHSHDRGYY